MEPGRHKFRNDIPLSANFLFDKLVLFLCCLAVNFLVTDDVSYIPVLAVVTLSAFNTYFDKRLLTRITSGAYLLIALFFPEWFYFIPVMMYDALLWESPWILPLAILPVISHRSSLPIMGILSIALYLGMAWFMKWRSWRLIHLEREYRKLRDTTKELLLSLEARNKELLEKQDYEINLATLNERNRMARDIHDNIGHVLSSTLLQVGALLAVTPEGSVKESLATLKDTLSSGMDSIRQSVHHLHDASIDLHAEIYKILKGFTFCPVNFIDDLESKPSLPITYCLLAVIREALSNTSKHSDATEVTLILREHPALYQLIIRDNGSKPAEGLSLSPESEYIPGRQGIGLKSIYERVGILKGNVRIRSDRGFEVFVSIPKEYDV